MACARASGARRAVRPAAPLRRRAQRRSSRSRCAELVAQAGRVEVVDHARGARRARAPAGAGRRWPPPRPAPRWAHCRPRARPARPRASGSPCRLMQAADRRAISLRSFSPPGSCSSARPTLASMRYCAASSIETPFRLRDLRLRIHLRRAGGVLHRLARDTRADLRVERADLLVVRRQRLAPPAGRSSRGRSTPASEPNQAFSSIVPSGAKSGFTRVARITAVSAAGMWAMLVTTAPLAENTGLLGREERIDAELLHEPAFLGERVVAAARIAPAWPTARVSLPSSGRPRRPPPAWCSRHRARSSRRARSTAPRPCCARRWPARRRTRARRSGCRRPCRWRSASSCPSRPCAGTARWWW